MWTELQEQLLGSTTPGHAGPAVEHRTVVVPTQADADWTVSLLSRAPGRVPLGLRVQSVDMFLTESLTAALGAAIPRDRLLQCVKTALKKQPTFDTIADDTRFAAQVLQTFANLSLARVDANAAAVHGLTGRDEAIVTAWKEFCTLVEKESPDGWWRGNAATRLGACWREVPTIRRGSVHVVQTSSCPAWLMTCVADWQAAGMNVAIAAPPALAATPGATATDLGSLDKRWPQGPSWYVSRDANVECAALVRELRRAVARVGSDMKSASVSLYCPAEDVARWVERLRAHQTPVRATCASTGGGARMQRFIELAVRGAAGERLNRAEIITLLNQRLVHAGGEQAGEDVAPQDTAGWKATQDIIANMRRNTGSLRDWIARIDQSSERLEKRLSLTINTAVSDDITDEDRDDARQKLELLKAAGERCKKRLSEITRQHTANDLRAWLSSVAPPSSGPVESGYRRTILQLLAQSGDSKARDVLGAVLEAGERFGNSTSWTEDTASDGTPVVDIVPFGTLHAPGTWTIFAGLDAWPRLTSTNPLMTDRACAALGLGDSTQAFADALSWLDERLFNDRPAMVWLSERTHDVAGSHASTAVWRAAMPETWLKKRGNPTMAGLNALTADKDDYASVLDLRVAHQRDHADRDDAFSERFAAYKRRISEELTEFSGDLGVAVRTTKYSVSALQQYATTPYLYFVRRVLGVREEEEVSDTLNAAETGTVIHNVLEKMTRTDVETGEVCTSTVTADSVNKEFSDKADGVIATDIWTDDSRRWSTELELWFKDRNERPKTIQTALAKAQTAIDAEAAAALADSRAAQATAPGKALAAEFKIEQPRQSGQPLDLPLSSGRTLRLDGYIDRIERLTEVAGEELDGTLAIVDFKTAKGKAGAFRAGALQGTHLQLPVYAMALSHMDDKPEELSGDVGVIRLEHTKRKDPKSQTATFLTPALRLNEPFAVYEGREMTPTELASFYVDRFVDAIESGHFPLGLREVDSGPYVMAPLRLLGDTGTTKRTAQKLSFAVKEFDEDAAIENGGDE